MPDQVRAKFKCQAMAKRIGWGSDPYHYDYHFMAVTSGSEENKSFYAATPSGDLKLTGIRDDLFEVGKEYYLDFTVSQ